MAQLNRQGLMELDGVDHELLASTAVRHGREVVQWERGQGVLHPTAVEDQPLRPAAQGKHGAGILGSLHPPD